MASFEAQRPLILLIPLLLRRLVLMLLLLLDTRRHLPELELNFAMVHDRHDMLILMLMIETSVVGIGIAMVVVAGSHVGRTGRTKERIAVVATVSGWREIAPRMTASAPSTALSMAMGRGERITPARPNG